jgi:DNA repair exonuclease SbcCD nuclease subunit
VRIIHTADIHLRAVGDERWNALETILRYAEHNDAAIIVISGDMFDSHAGAQRLKVPLRELFQNIPFPIVILPGNHDARSLSSGDFFGENVTILGDATQFIDVEDVRVLGLPFEKIIGEKVIERLFAVRGNVSKDLTNILLYHGELIDVVFSREGFGDEEESGYMPVRLSFFDGIGIDYVLGGHLHSNFDVHQFDGGYFVYPGSPVSITKKETGVRKINSFEIGKPPEAVDLETHHYIDMVVKLNPFTIVDPIAEIQRRIRDCRSSACILLTVSGFVNLARLRKTESEFASEIQEVKTPQVESIASNWRDVGSILEDDIFERFEQRLFESELTEVRKVRIRELVIESMMEDACED